MTWPLSAQPAPERDSPELIRQALESPALDRQRAALVLIPELGLKDAAAAATARHLAEYLKRSVNAENRRLALSAYAKLSPPAGLAAPVLKDALADRSAQVRLAAGLCLDELVVTSTRNFGRPGIFIVGTPGSVAMAGGGAAGVAWFHNWVPAMAGDERVWVRFSEDARLLLPLCQIALKDPDDRVKRAGADGIRQLARAISEVLPDPASSNSDTKVIDPLEAKLKWLLLQPALQALNVSASALEQATQAQDIETRRSATRAVEAVMQARAMALASRRFPPNDFSILSSNPPPEDPLLSGTAGLLPALARRLNDPSPDIRLVAIEGFEHQGADARPFLASIVDASRNADVFVRWVATRTLGRLYDGAMRAERAIIISALAERAADTDLDVRSVALTALGKGGNVSRPATSAVVRLAASGDPDMRVQAMRTLALIDANRSETLPAMGRILLAETTRVRKAAVIYLASLGTDARLLLPEIRPLLLDPDEEVRRETARALLAIE